MCCALLLSRGILTLLRALLLAEYRVCVFALRHIIHVVPCSD